MQAKFYICRHCGNLAVKIQDSGVPMVCCGEKMEALNPTRWRPRQRSICPLPHKMEGLVHVAVGSVAHPMIPEHSILWICLQTEKGCQLKMLHPGEAPEADFALAEDKPLAVFAYCNLHGLWMSEL